MIEYQVFSQTDIGQKRKQNEDSYLVDPELHLFLVAVLMIVFPLSKLLHAPGVFFSPTRNQVDNPREKRHIAPWAAEMEK